jgi:hypothetical protein
MFYKLNEHRPVQCDNVLEWAQWLETAGDCCVVAQDDIDDYFVSTTFLGLDPRPSLKRDPPLLFETMIFEGADDSSGATADRYPTGELAEAGHRRVVLRIRNSREVR